jgi:tetratricopeptide (TPR) repeat protein
MMSNLQPKTVSGSVRLAIFFSLSIFVLSGNTQVFGQQRVPVDPPRPPRAGCVRSCPTRHHVAATPGGVFSEALQAVPQDRDFEVEVYLFLGNKARAAGDYPEAKIQYEKVLSLKSDEWRANYGLGNVFFDLAFKGEGPTSMNKAIDEYNKAAKAAASDPTADKIERAELHSDLAQAYLQRGRIPEAQESVRAALELNRNSASAIRRGANILQVERKFDEAIRDYKKSLAIEDNALTRRALGAAFYASKEFDNALTEFKRAVRLRPDYETGYADLREYFSRERKHTEALKEFTEALVRNPAEAHYGLAVAYSALGDKAAAQKEYDKLKTVNAKKAADLKRELPSLVN